MTHAPSQGSARGPLAAWALLVAVVIGVVALYPELAPLWVFVSTLPFAVIFASRRLSGPRGAGLRPPARRGGDPDLRSAGRRLDLGEGGGRAARPDPERGRRPGDRPARGVHVPTTVVGAAARRESGPPAAGVAMLLVLGPPVFFTLLGEIKGDERALTIPPTVVSELDVVVLGERGESAKIKAADTRGWRIRPWIGSVAGDEVRWGPDGAPPPAAPSGADRIILLLVDGGPERLDRAGELPSIPPPARRGPSLARSRRQPLARAHAGLRPPAYERRCPARAMARPAGAMARAAGAARRRSALAAGVRRPADPDGPGVEVRRVRGHERFRPRPGGAIPTCPLLRPRGPYRTPLKIDQLLASGTMRLCNRGQAVRTLRAEVDESADLQNGGDHLAFDPDEVSRVRADSTIYVNVTRSGNAHRNAIYLDYWWYFPHNPTDAGGCAFCGVGFVIAGITCHDHQSGWEGVTVVLDGDSGSGSPTGEPERRVRQVSRISGEPDIVTLTIGGNDAGYADVLKHCVVEADCTERYRTPDGDLLDREIARLAERLPALDAAIGQAAPAARLVVVGYPRLFPADQCPSPGANCAAARQISSHEAAYLNERTRALNAAIAGAARAAGAEFIDVTEASDGAELRCTGQPT